MTPGVTAETVDGMRLGKIQAIIDALRSERYRWTPVRRVYIQKKGTSEEAPAGVADLVGQAAARSDPPAAGGVLRAAVLRPLPRLPARPGLSHRAAGRSTTSGVGQPGSSKVTSPTASAVLDHQIMLSILAEKIHDNRFLRLIDGLLQAGYLEDWRYHATLSGCPQGGVISARSCPISTWTGWTSTSRRPCCPPTTGETDASPIGLTCGCTRVITELENTG